MNDTATPKVKGTVKFGLLFHPTPDTAKTVARVVLYGAAIVNFILATFPNMPEAYETIVGQYSTWVVGLVYFLCHMFGIEPQGPPKTDNSTIK